MKRLLSLIYLMLFCLSCFCQTATKTNPIRTVLYTCGSNDEFYCYEYYSNMKVVGNKFACITKNKNTGKLSFILNGMPVITAKNIDVFWIDLTSKSKCIYTYSDADKEAYIVIEGHKYGPYANIRYWQHACGYYWDGTPNLNLIYNKDSFWFERMGKYYRHDNDGSIYEMTGKSLWGAEESNPQFKTKDGLHSARFSENYRLLTIDGNNYVMPIDVDAEDIDLRDFYLTDNGDCVIYFAFKSDSWKYPYLYINSDKKTVENIQDGEYFDPTSRAIKPKTSNLPSRQPRQMESIMRWRDGDWINGIDISLQDKSNRHFFTANWNYDYVMVDDKKIGKQTPINAFYDAVNNAFGWVTIEGKQLVLYSYKL